MAPVTKLVLIPRGEFHRVRLAGVPRDERLALLADMARANALTAVKRAGSGHLGSSFSAMDIVTFLFEEELTTAQLGWDHPDRDIYFSSKGHDVPGLYAVLHSLGVIPTERLLRLRRLGGLDGHPDIHVPGIEANSGSLGMGISKGRGMAWAKRFLGRAGRVVVMTGDGELQEGQNWEALQAAAHEAMGNLVVVVDRNELQSDKRTEEILGLGDLEQKLRSFGWYVDVCSGHSFLDLRETFEDFGFEAERPKVLIAETIKGKGVSFMEHPAALKEGGGTYRWHAGAPDDDAFERAFGELTERIAAGFEVHELGELSLEPVPLDEEPFVSLEGEPVSGAGARSRPKLKESAEYVAETYGEALIELADRVPEVVVVDADLASDCRIRGFELRHPSRFVEVGIAEQDMVSMAAGLARQGLLPVVNSFASFLASRANEQIYNAASEDARIVYGCHYAGLIPAGPGKSHQSIRDVSLLAALPNVTVVQPANSEETRALVEWAVVDASDSVAIRLAIGPSPRRLELPADATFAVGCGTVLMEGADAVALSYGPVMLHETLTAAEALRARGIRLAVVDMPWLNRFDDAWLEQAVAPYEHVFVVEDHSPVGALGDALRRELQRPVSVFGVEGWPACGTPVEALRFHGLDGASLAERIAAAVGA
ncbi:MAG TPA: transketolase C-terminal domain-containing protein [Gaiellaceae bacterium]|nr:transketolase C-terminal domain-containing protein [Gaiellaceae bacterium]